MPLWCPHWSSRWRCLSEQQSQKTVHPCWLVVEIFLWFYLSKLPQITNLDLSFHVSSPCITWRCCSVNGFFTKTIWHGKGRVPWSLVFCISSEVAFVSAWLVVNCQLQVEHFWAFSHSMCPWAQESHSAEYVWPSLSMVWSLRWTELLDSHDL